MITALRKRNIRHTDSVVKVHFSGIREEATGDNVSAEDY